MPSIFEVNWPPHCCFSLVRILLSWSSLALLSKRSRRASFFLQIIMKFINIIPFSFIFYLKTPLIWKSSELPIKFREKIFITDISKQLHYLQTQKVYNHNTLQKSWGAEGIKDKQRMDLFQSLFNCFITQFLTPTFLENVITKSCK